VLTEAATPTLLRQVRAGRLDVAVIGAGDGLPDYDLEGLRRTTLTHGTLVVAVPAAHRFGDTTTEAELAHEQWIVGEGEPGEPQFGAWPTLPEPRVATTVRSWSTRLGMVAAGLGITVVPALVRPALPAGVRPVRVLESDWPGRSTLSITRPDPTPQARAMITALHEEAAALSRGSSRQTSV
jgi:DNA-binding transcriptional LysR family regulator